MDSESKKSTLEVRDGCSPPRNSHPYDRRHVATLPGCFSVPLDPNVWTSDNMSVTGCPRFGTLVPSDSEMARNPNALSSMKALLFVHVLIGILQVLKHQHSTLLSFPDDVRCVKCKSHGHYDGRSRSRRRRRKGLLLPRSRASELRTRRGAPPPPSPPSPIAMRLRTGRPDEGNATQDLRPGTAPPSWRCRMTPAAPSSLGARHLSTYFCAWHVLSEAEVASSRRFSRGSPK